MGYPEGVTDADVDATAPAAPRPWLYCDGHCPGCPDRDECETEADHDDAENAKTCGDHDV